MEGRREAYWRRIGGVLERRSQERHNFGGGGGGAPRDPHTNVTLFRRTCVAMTCEDAPADVREDYGSSARSRSVKLV